MAEKVAPIKKLSEKNTKQEMLETYQALVKQLEEKRQAELNPERRLEEKKADEAVKAAAAVANEGIDREIGGLKAEIGKMLSDVAERLGAEALRFRQVQKAVQAKEAELRELYGIEKAAASLAALIEAQNQKRREFEAESTQEHEALTREIEETREAWQKERQTRDAETREREAAGTKTASRWMRGPILQRTIQFSRNKTARPPRRGTVAPAGTNGTCQMHQQDLGLATT